MGPIPGAPDPVRAGAGLSATAPAAAIKWSSSMATEPRIDKARVNPPRPCPARTRVRLRMDNLLKAHTQMNGELI